MIANHGTAIYLSYFNPPNFLDYGNIICYPNFILDNKAMERVQKKTAKLVRALKDCS